MDALRRSQDRNPVPPLSTKRRPGIPHAVVESDPQLTQHHLPLVRRLAQTKPEVAYL
jgi:hypothetical protein